MKHSKVLFGLIVAATLVFAGCGGDKSAAEDEAASIPAYDSSKAYTVSIGGYGDLEKAYTEVSKTDAFKEKFPNVTLEFQSAEFGSHHNRLTTVLAAGEATNDIEALEAGFIAKFVEGGGLTNLSKEPFNGVADGENLVDFSMANATTKDGVLVAYPVDIAPAVMFYRKSLFDDAGVKIEDIQSWEDYIEAGKKVTKDTNGDGELDQFMLPHASDVAWIPLNGGKGGWFSSAGLPLEPKERFIKVLEIVTDVREAGIDADLSAWTGPWIESFANGTVASMVNGAWFGGALKTWIATDLSGDWRVAKLPGNEDASLGGTYLSIPAGVPDEKKAVAWEVIKFLSTNETAQKTTFRTIGAYPALTSVYDDPMMNEGVEYFGGQKVRQIYAEVAENIPEMEVTEYDAAIHTVFGNTFTDVLVNGTEPEKAYEKALNNITALMD